MNLSLLPLGAALLALGLGALPTARAQNVKPPKAQLWMDVSTGGMAGMPEMDASSGMGAMLGGLMGGSGGGAGGNTTYGMARGMTIMPPRVLDIALYNRLKPGVEAAQLIPPGVMDAGGGKQADADRDHQIEDDEPEQHGRDQ